MTRIIGIDPGLRTTGFGVIEKNGNTLRYIASGCVKSSAGQSLPERILTLFSGVNEVIAQYAPAEAAVEKVFVNVNPQSTLLLGQARGAVIAALSAQGLPVAEYTALQIKQAVVGQGKALKKQVQYMVARLLSLSGAPQPDAADALACAICHAHGGLSRMVSSGIFAKIAPSPDGAAPAHGYRIRKGRLSG